MANPDNLSQPRKQVSIEHGGLGQSGYTAGRKEGDAALDDVLDTRYAAPPGSGSDGLGLDDRFTGRGGPVSDVERDGPGAPGPASSEPDGASGRRDADRDDPLDRSDRTDERGNPRRG
jgi:hypothetical protein